jgi:signal transduction histidine kinase
MFSAARLRLSGWYLLILSLIVALLSAPLYYLLLLAQRSELKAIHSGLGHAIDLVFADDDLTLASQIVALGVATLLVAALGAYLLAGRTLQPIEEVMDRQRRFAAAASHELRTPLTILQGSLEVALLNRRTPEEYEQTIQEAVEELVHMSQLVRDLLVVARSESEADAILRVPLCLGEVAHAALARIEPVAQRKGQTLEVTLPDRLQVWGDALKLRQALLNLLENAVLYSADGGVIRVVGRQERGRAVLEVRDTGPGIAGEHLRHLFEPFYQVDRAQSGSGQVGLGLALVAWIVRAHGGQIEVASRVGAGTVFTLSLPSTA